MNTKATHPAFPPQILLDNFQRPVAPVPGMTMLEHFSLEIFKAIVNSDDAHATKKLKIDVAVGMANEFLNVLQKFQAENTIKFFDDENE